MYNILFYFTLFMIISCIGWFCEMIYTNIETKKLTNRGFLLGPYCPIYGATSLVMLQTLKAYQNDIVILFIVAAVICSIVEYMTSYIMEKIFKARWWDYSNMPFNIDGRVCILNSFLFGVGAVILFNCVPYIEGSIEAINTTVFYILSISLLFIFIIDFAFSFNVIFKFKLTVEAIQKDYTGEISSRVRKIIMKQSYPFRRLVTAFPNQMIIGLKKRFFRK
jgi:Predicted membrane protein